MIHYRKNYIPATENKKAKSCRNSKSCPGPYLLNDTNWKRFVKEIGGSGSSGNKVIRVGQINANTFVANHVKSAPQIAPDGVRGSETRKQCVRVLQLALNLDYDAGLAVDGIVGAKTRAAVKSRSVKKGQKSYMVLAAKILYQCSGKDAGMKYSRTYGAGLVKTAGKEKISDFLGLLD